MPTPDDQRTVQRQNLDLSQERFEEHLRELARRLKVPVEQVRQLAAALKREFPYESERGLLAYVVVFHRMLAEQVGEEETEERQTIAVRCRNCEWVQCESMSSSSLSNYQAQSDGTYALLSPFYCAECVPDDWSIGQEKEEAEAGMPSQTP